MVRFLVLALFYGHHPELARRCGASLRALWNTGRVDLRIGLNEVSPATRAVLDELLPGVAREEADPQIYKFPMMRRLLDGYAGDATHMMWFDDDSCLLPGVDVRGWLDAVSRRAETAASLGSVYEQPLTPAQRAWIAAQPWASGREVPHTVQFNTGGWLVVRLDLIRRFGWPEPALLHFGGDLTLGALLHQQGLMPEQFRVGLAINADANLLESQAARRGLQQRHGGDVWGHAPGG